jgi:hypothetical protein
MQMGESSFIRDRFYSWMVLCFLDFNVSHFVNVSHPATSQQGVHAITIGYGFSNEIVHEL